MEKKILIIILVFFSIFNSITAMEQTYLNTKKEEINYINSNEISDDLVNKILDLPIKNIWEKIVISHNLKLSDKLPEIKKAILTLLNFSLVSKKCNYIANEVIKSFLKLEESSKEKDSKKAKLLLMNFFYKSKDEFFNEIEIKLKNNGVINTISNPNIEILNYIETYQEVAEQLKQNNTDSTFKSWLNNSLIYSSIKGYKSTIEFLILSGADINYKNNSGQTALIQATKNGHKEIVELLTKYGVK